MSFHVYHCYKPKSYHHELQLLIYKYLKRAYDHGTTDKEAREAIAHAATIAGIAFGNAYLGVVHSLSHKIGGHFGVMHGAANAIYLPYNTKKENRL